MKEQEIGLLDVYREVVRLAALMEAYTEQARDHETRLRALERWRYALPASIVVGGAGLVTALLGGVHHA